jgi:hypothetical protein
LPALKATATGWSGGFVQAGGGGEAFGDEDG